jgi:hypothetical protein
MQKIWWPKNPYAKYSERRKKREKLKKKQKRPKQKTYYLLARRGLHRQVPRRIYYKARTV